MQPPVITAPGLVFLAIGATVVWLPPESDGRAMALYALLATILFAVAARPRLQAIVPFAIALGAIGISAGLALSPLAAIAPLATWSVAGALFFAGAAARHGELGRWPASGPRLADLLGASAALLALLALYQRFGGLERLAARIAADPAIPDRQLLLERVAEGRPFGTLSTPAALGVLLAMALPGLALGAWRVRGAGRWVRLGMCVVIGAALAATASITAIAALAGGVVLLSLQRLGGERRWRAAAVVLVLLVAVAAVAIASRGGELFDPDARRGPIRLRLGNYLAASAMVADDPLRGVGPGSFGEAYAAYRRPGDNETRHVHNLPLELAAELGLPLGAPIALGLLWLGLVPALRLREVEAAGPAAAVAILTLHNLLDYTLFLPSLLWLGALLAGWLHAGRRPSSCGAPPAATLVLALAAGLLVLDGLSGEALRASRLAAAAADPALAERRAARAVALAPWNLDALVALATTSSAERPDPTDEGRLARLLDHGEAAVAAAPRRASARMARARARLFAGDVVGAYVDLRRACELHPTESSYREARDTLRQRLGAKGPAR